MPSDLPSDFNDLKDHRNVDNKASTFFPSHMVFCSNMTFGLNLTKHLLWAIFLWVSLPLSHLMIELSWFM